MPLGPTDFRAVALVTLDAVRRRHPQAWREAHALYNAHGLPSGLPPARVERFIRLAAGAMHATVDARFGLNGKRGSPTDLSLDALAFRLSDDPTDVWVVDCIRGAGLEYQNTPGQEIGWDDVTDPGGAGGRWLDPFETSAGGTAPAQPYPDEPGWWGAVFEPAVGRLYLEAGRAFPDNPAAFRWFARTAYDIAAGTPKELSMVKHLDELRAELGL